jgi:hypothetical protein
MKTRSVCNLIILIVCWSTCVNHIWADVSELRYGSYKISHELTLPGSPQSLYDAITGDISGWWDHTFSDSPLRFYIEAKPGGGFYEIFDEEGNGVLHATVIVADRGKLLRFDGPLGLSGRAVKIVHTYTFSPVGTDSTRITLSVHMSGEIDEDLAKIVDQVWTHFLFERFKPFIEEGKHLLIPFEENNKWGYKNKTGRIIIEAKFQVANPFNRYGIATVVDDHGWVYINRNGEYLLRPYVIDNGPDYISEGLIRFVVNRKIGFMNEYGVQVIPATFDFVSPFSEGLAAFCTGCSEIAQGEYHRFDGGKWGYINKTGEIVVAPEYDSAGSFKDGKAEVVKGEEVIILIREDVKE